MGSTCELHVLLLEQVPLSSNFSPGLSVRFLLSLIVISLQIRPKGLLPQGLCTCRSLYLECFPPRYLPSLHLVKRQLLSQMTTPDS